MSHETIYKSLFVQSRGALSKELDKAVCAGFGPSDVRTTARPSPGSAKITNMTIIPASVRPKSLTARCPVIGKAT